MSAATSSRSCATWSRSASGSCARRGGAGGRREGRARRRGTRARRPGRQGCERRRRATPSASELRAGELDDKEIEIEVDAGRPACRCSRSRACRALGRRDLDRRHVRQGLRPAQQDAPRARSRTACDLLVADESDKLLDNEAVVQEAMREVENNGIVFLDEIDKICAREGRGGADVSREGVQRDLLPLIEGTTVATKHGPVKTDHILFIASGAFHVVEAVRPAARVAGPAADPRRAVPLDRGGFRPHPDGDRSEPDQAIRRAAGDRGREARFHRRRHRGHRPLRLRGELVGREYRRTAPADDDRAGARRHFASRRPIIRGRPSRSMPPMCASGWLTSPRIYASRFVLLRAWLEIRRAPSRPPCAPSSKARLPLHDGETPG